MQFWTVLALVATLNICDANANTPPQNVQEWYLILPSGSLDHIETNVVIEDPKKIPPHNDDGEGAMMNERDDVFKKDLLERFDVAEEAGGNPEDLDHRDKRIYPLANNNLDDAEKEITKEVVPEYIHKGGKKKLYPFFKLKHLVNSNPIDGSTYFEDSNTLPDHKDLERSGSRRFNIELKPQLVFEINLFYPSRNFEHRLEEDGNHNSNLKIILSRAREKRNELVNMEGRSLSDTLVGRDILSQLVDKSVILKDRPEINEDYLESLLGEIRMNLHHHKVKSHQPLLNTDIKSPVVQKRIFSIFSKWKQFSPVNQDVKFRRPSYVYRNYPGVQSEDRDFVITETRGSMRVPGSPLRWG